ncbi:MAG: hypothetical protein J7M26_03735, partial [Armatimonadetes bacterium]|nr:hypothetical protein [Armatimonadota bacterium]
MLSQTSSLATRVLFWLARVSLLATLAALGSCYAAPQQAAGGQEYVWWEGENPVATNFPKQSWFSPTTFENNRDQLSGGDWLSNSGPRKGDEAFARYEIEVPADGEYSFWVRKFWKHGPFRWRFDDGEWHICGRNIALADSTFLRNTVVANWVSLGKVKLTRGKHTFELRLLAKPGEQLTAAFDCFILTRGVFVPNGKYKPGQRTGLADEGFFAWEPPPDKFTDDALLDLRYLNEKEAGEHGWVRHEGDGFVLGDGRPVRFWAVNVGPNNVGQDHASIDYLARALAKRGVNLVRYHGPIFDPSSPDPAKVDRKRLDDIFYLVAALKRQGIYTELSFYFPLWFDIKPTYGIPGYETIANKKPFALLYFNERMQQIHRSWARQLLTTPNPYTGKPLGQDPAVAIVEIVNEDSFFFWTFSPRNVPRVHWQRLEELFGAWAAQRYGSLDKALAAWGRAHHPDDDAAAGRAGLFDAWHMTSDGLKKAGGPDKLKRIGDQVRFLTELQRGFYQGFVKYLRDDLDCRALVSPSNWHVTDPVLLDALERYTYTAGDVVDKHGYFSGKHQGQGASYSVREGHTFSSLAAVTVPDRLPLQFLQVGGYPQMISEIGWPNPNRYRADATFLAAAYGALQGVDAFCWFAVGSNFLADRSMQKFAVSCPLVAGSFPATALVYRLALVHQADEAVHQILRLDDLYAMKGSGLSSAQALDELRKKDIPPGGQVVGEVSKLDPLACYVGRVVRTFGDHPEQSRQIDLSRYIDHGGKTIASMTGELKWDYGRGLVTVDAPACQGAAGFLGRAGKIELSNVTVQCANEYAAVLVVAMDGQPLATSRKILIQATTQEQPYGFKVEGGKIVTMGGAPYEVERIHATLTLSFHGQG